MFKVGDRVKTDLDFLSNGYVAKLIPEINSCVVKLDEKAPNEYAYETDEVLMFNAKLTLVEE